MKQEKIHTDIHADIHNLITRLIHQGKIKRPSICSQCSVTGKIETHHPNYNKPLKIVWLCRSCHQSLHKREKLLREYYQNRGKVSPFTIINS